MKPHICKKGDYWYAWRSKAHKEFSVPITSGDTIETVYMRTIAYLAAFPTRSL